MTLTPFNENNLWGIRNSADKIVLPAIYSELSVFIFKAAVLLTKFETNKIRRTNKPVTAQTEILVEPKSDIIFLVKKSNEFYLLKWSYNRFSHQSGILNLFKQFDTLESFGLSPYNTYKNNVVEKTDIVEIGKFYRDIIHIGSGLFKVKIINVFKRLEPINEDGEHAWEYRFDSFYWQIIDFNGNLISEKSYTEVDIFINNLCKIRIGDKRNFIDETGKQVLDDWHYHLDYPILDNDVFLAGKKSYSISLYSENGMSLFKTTDLFHTDELTYEDPSNESLSFLKKISKSPLPTTDLTALIERLFGDMFSTIRVEEITNLDLYNAAGFIKRLGIAGLTALSDELNVAEIHTDFFGYFLTSKKGIKLCRHREVTKLNSIDFSFDFAQLRLVDNKGNFLNSNYYHLIFSFNENGLCKVAKSFFQVIKESKIELIDTSIDEIETDGEIEFWTEAAGHNEYGMPLKSPILKYGVIDKDGKEIIECKFDEEELDNKLRTYNV